MTTEQAKQLSESALTRLMAALEQGHCAALKQYLAVMSRFRKYSWTNCLLICSQFPAATFVGGFHFWLKLGRHVRKGEKGIAILAPMVGRKRSSDDEELQENDQARVFLVIVELHSGYFVRRQFEVAIGVERGKRTSAFVEKLLTRGHARRYTFEHNRQVFQLQYKPFYEAVGDDHSRNRREQ